MNKQELLELKHYLQSLPRLADTNKPERLAKSKKSFFHFVQTYFPHHIEHAKKETSKFRNWVYKDLRTISNKNRHTIITAYRGAAKTTVISQLFTLWSMIAKQEVGFAVIISATDSLAEQMCELIKTELEDNANLIHDYNIQRPSTWRATEFVFKVDKKMHKIMGYGITAKFRGVKFLSLRPDLIIIDDIENDENIESKAQRDKMYKKFTKAVMRLPARKKKYRLIVVGTVLHHDSVLSRLSKRQDFASFNFPLVLKFPTHLDTSQSTTGIQLDDPEIDAKELMVEYFEDKAGFMAEYQNTPLTQEGRTFESYTTYDEMPKCQAYYIGIDPALGKKNGDYFGLAVVGKDDSTLYADVKGYKMSPTRMIAKIIHLYTKLSNKAPTVIAIETVQFQEFYKDTLKKEAAKLGILLSIKPLRNNKAPKALRIESLAPMVNDGTILILSTNHLLKDELDTHPKPPHDDLLDALEMAVRIAKKASKLNYKEIRKKLLKHNFPEHKDKYA